MKSNEILIVEDLWKSYGNHIVLKGISFNVREGETKVIIGPSGSGKSTLLRCINLLIKPDRGSIVFDGIDITKLKSNISEIRSRIGFVFQHFNLFNHLTALDNVALGLIKVKRKSRSEAYNIAKEALLSVGITEDLWHKYPSQLSGGQQQRVAIARAIAMEPKIILFDEPTSALDPELVSEVLNVMENLSRKGMTMIVVTHEIGFAIKVADEIMFMDNGVIIERGDPRSIIFNPKNERVKKFMEKLLYVYKI
ncbi:amino acid ABC transporter ATP-binding protein, PAAT family [Ignisphaera aggregans DSM 17230]|uniref:Amino acid ABC transporter ATP-binding protein, PAAT family n=1 Tax=Ignisphaera aggregans (strain DSM 17230 / JCM 13409 / AQ1.S1) TaxID=583356 RepID=E0SRA4_IGNAA|nr:amino acid ABC transporter ATP-binding protein, PAAT family [Ignisphaera aggregans DSM 17230]